MASGFAIVLPARYASTRFPGKPLAVIAGKPLIEWVYRRAEQIRGAEHVVVATEDDRVVSVVEGFGGRVIRTSDTHKTGTDRVAEVARSLDSGVIVNLQGDEPIFPLGLVEEMIDVINDADDVDIVTACHAIREDVEMSNPNIVKVVLDASKRALYFSRSPIPHSRGRRLVEDRGTEGHTLGYRHIGIYVFRRSSLLRFSEMPCSVLEVTEGLEQLRALDAGMVIRVVETTQLTVGVDVPNDVKSVEKALGTA